MSKKIDQKEYLKKYLSGDKTTKKKKSKKRKKHSTPTVKIFDDDLTVNEGGQKIDEELLLTGEDAPQIVGACVEELVNEKGVSKWKSISVKEEIDSDKDEKKDDDLWGKKASEIKISDDFSPKRIKKEKHRGNTPDFEANGMNATNHKKRRDDDDSHRRRHRNSKYSSPSKFDQNLSNKQIDSDESPPRRRIQTPPGKRRKSNEMQPKREIEIEERDLDLSPPRRRINADMSPPRRRIPASSRTRMSSDESPPRRRIENPHSRRRDSDESPPRRRPNTKRRDSHSTSPKRSRPDLNNDSDISPPRRHRRSSPRHLSSNGTHNRYGNVESSQLRSPTRRRKESPLQNERRNRRDSPRNNRHRSPNAERRQHSPSWGQNIKKEKRTPSPSPLKNKRQENISMKNLSESPPPTHKPKATKTLEGKKAGLQDATGLKVENEERRRQEDLMFENMSKDLSGRDAEVQVRSTGRKGRRAREAETEDPEKRRKREEFEKERQEHYARLSKGLKQIEDYKVRKAEEAHESNKPLARYKNDEDLDRHLREQERLDDPMLQYMRQKKKKQEKEAGIPSKPIYEGPFPENRFGIRPGYRWDGVDRSNGYEKKWFDVQSEKHAKREEAYLYSVEDM